MNTQFPTMVYKCPGSHQCQGGTYHYKAAKDAQQMAELAKTGWHPSLEAALSSVRIVGQSAQAPADIPEPAADDDAANSAVIRAYLSAKLNDAGIDHDEGMHEDELIFLLFCEFAELEAGAEPLEGAELEAKAEGDDQGGATGSDDNAPPTRAELETMATELGIKFDGRTTDAGLLKKINAELESK